MYQIDPYPYVETGGGRLAWTLQVRRGGRPSLKTKGHTMISLKRALLITAMIAGVVVAAPGTAGALPTLPTPCDFQQPSSYPLNYHVEATSNTDLRPISAPTNFCSSQGSIEDGEIMRVYATSLGMLYVESLNGSGWGWIPEGQTRVVSLANVRGSVSSDPEPIFGVQGRVTSGEGSSSTFKANVGSITPAPTPTSVPSNSVNCSWYQPETYVTNYVKTATKSAPVQSRNHHTCKTISTIQRGDQVKVHSEKDDYRFIENLTQSKWGWVHKSVFDGSSSATPSSAPTASSGSCDWVQPTTYVSNYTAYGRTTYNMRPQPNTNCPTDNKLYADDTVTVHAHSGDWRFIENHTRSTWGWVHKDGFR